MKRRIAAIIATAAMGMNILCGCVTGEVPHLAETKSHTETETAAESAEETIAKEEAEEKNREIKNGGAIMFCGSTSLYPIMSSLASSFTEEYVTWDKVDSSLPDSNISIYVAPGGSGVGVSAVLDGTADFGMVAREVKDKEKEALGEGYKEFVVARDALTVSVNSENPVAGLMEDMDSDTIRKIFSGEISKWNELDPSLPDEDINVYIRDLSGGAYEVFQKAIMGDSEITPSATQSASMTELATNVAGDPNGIGYVGFGAYNKANTDKKVLTAMKVDGVAAEEETILSGEYKVQRPVLFCTGNEITPIQQKFIDYIFSEAGFEAVEKNGYIPAFQVN
ncbi:ABC-type phosphate transport system, periplasmic component [Lachnospiraceae bacterium JC7]|nr:ABC-type phosphate transport system, periplasmic component [Lachnospiraceae bacterium JC7]